MYARARLHTTFDVRSARRAFSPPSASPSRLRHWCMLRRPPTRIELKTEDKEEVRIVSRRIARFTRASDPDDDARARRLTID